MTYWLLANKWLHSAALHTTTNQHINMPQLKRKTISLLHMNYTVANYPPSPSICLGPCKRSPYQTRMLHPPIYKPSHTTQSDETLESLEWRWEREHQYVTHLPYLSQRRSTKVAARNGGTPFDAVDCYVVSWVEGTIDSRVVSMVELVTTWNWNGISDIYFTDLTEFQHAVYSWISREREQVSVVSV